MRSAKAMARAAVELALDRRLTQAADRTAAARKEAAAVAAAALRAGNASHKVRSPFASDRPYKRSDPPP